MRERLSFPPTVMTLDAGGTHFVFSAIRDAIEVVSPITYPSYADDLQRCLQTIIQGFEAVYVQLGNTASAISFAFPGPADYAAGIIGDLGNLPAFRGGVALGPMLEEHFNIPVFINNDGDLFTYGEAQYGLLPYLNHKLEKHGSQKQFHNLIGVTIGTGFGGGIVRNNELWSGDNGAGAEIWLMRNPLNEKWFAEESLSIRAVTQTYYQLAFENGYNKLQPFDIFQIAMGRKAGNQKAAVKAFELVGEALGFVIAELITILDASVVIGGGISNAAPLFLPKTMEVINSCYESVQGKQVPRLESKIVNLTNERALKEILQQTGNLIEIPFSIKKVSYNPLKWVGIGTTILGTNKAVALGAYAFAVYQLNKITSAGLRF